MWGVNGARVGFGRNTGHDSFIASRKVEPIGASSDLNGQYSNEQDRRKLASKPIVPLSIERPYHGNQHIRPPSYRAYDGAGRSCPSGDYSGRFIDITEFLS